MFFITNSLLLLNKKLIQSNILLPHFNFYLMELQHEIFINNILRLQDTKLNQTIILLARCHFKKFVEIQ